MYHTRYIEPPAYDILTLYSWNTKAPSHGILTPTYIAYQTLSMLYQTPAYSILIPLSNLLLMVF